MEKRFADIWNGDLEEALCAALCAALAVPGDMCEIEDFNDTTIIYSLDGGLFQVPYTLDGGVPTIDVTIPLPVIEQTMYVPRSPVIDQETRIRALRRAEETEIEAQRLLLSL
jgi:hypothetical protein